MQRILRATVDWWVFFSAAAIMTAGLFTMNSFSSENVQFDRQLFFVSAGLLLMFLFSFVDFRFLRRTGVLVVLFGASIFLLSLLFVLGHTAKGAESWFHLFGFSFQPSDLAKLVLILMLSKYFSRRHVEIADIRHIFISGIYAFIPFVLILVQPDFGSAIALFFVWLGMSMVAGISKKHLALLFLAAAVAGLFFWQYVFAPYQKARIINFIHPLTDVRGGGYNANQSMIAVGSGELWGKGVGYGTQSRLLFLPEFETDFIFAAFAEEWGFLGVALLLFLYGILIWRLLFNASIGETNFETLFAVGLSMFFMTHIAVTIGMNMGVLPVTGISLPLMSYGGSHIITESIGLGILMGMRRYARATSRESLSREFLGLS